MNDELVNWAYETNFNYSYMNSHKENKIITHSIHNVESALRQLYYKDLRALKLIAVLVRQKEEFKKVYSDSSCMEVFSTLTKDVLISGNIDYALTRKIIVE